MIIMHRKIVLPVFILLFLIAPAFMVDVWAWSNGGFSADPSNPDYGTHDWIAHHALDWLPDQEKQYILDNLATYLYGTELPDNSQAPDGIGDTAKHHVYFNSKGVMTDGAAAVRASTEYGNTLSFLKSGDFAKTAKYAGVMSHYIVDMAVFGHVMGAGTDWGAEKHHSDYEDYVNQRTSSYEAEFNSYLAFDGSFDVMSAYEAAKNLAYDTTFDVDGDLTCVWMDQNYNWNNPSFRDRCGESLNLAVNYLTDVLHSLYSEALPTREFYRAEIAITTESDWTSLIIKSDEIILNARIDIIEGENAPDLHIGWTEDKIHIGKKSFDSTKVKIECLIILSKLKKDTNIDFEIQRGDIGYTKVEIYNFNGETPSLIKEIMHSRIIPSSGGLNPFSFSLKDDVLMGDGPLYVESRVPKLVWAFYYPWYHQAEWAGKVFIDHPFLGNYSSSNPSIIEKHIRLAKAAGIDGFIVSWWGEGTYTDQNLHTILETAERENFKITIYLEILKDGPRDITEIESILSDFFRKYGNDDRYYKLDDKPLIFVWAADSHPPEIWRNVFQNLNSKGYSARYMACSLNPAYLDLFNGLHTYGTIGIQNLGEVYNRTSNICKTYSLLNNLAESKIWAATICPGYDDRLVPGRVGYYQERQNGTYYGQTFNAAESSDPDWLLITSFNEWPENTYIEPSKKYGFNYLLMTEKFSADFKGIKSNPENILILRSLWETTPPVANAGPDQTVNEDTLVAFDGSGSSDDVGIVSYTWTFTDITPRTLSGVSPTYTFATPGVYTVTLNVTDAAGNWDADTVKVTVLDMTNPMADAGSDQTAKAGETINFNGGGSSDNVGIVSYEWDFGDGTIGTGATTTHTYTKLGTYTVTLTVRDKAGNSATDTMTVTVQEVAAPSPIPWWTIGVIVAVVTAVALAALRLLRRKT